MVEHSFCGLVLVPYDFSSKFTAHLKHGINRIVILDIDLHHGINTTTFSETCFLDIHIIYDSRQWHSINSVAN